MFILGFVWFGSLVGLLTIFFIMNAELKRYIQEAMNHGHVTKTPTKKFKVAWVKTIALYLVPVLNTLLLQFELIRFEAFAEKFWEEVDRQYGIED